MQWSKQQLEILSYLGFDAFYFAQDNLLKSEADEVGGLVALLDLVAPISTKIIPDSDFSSNAISSNAINSINSTNYFAENVEKVTKEPRNLPKVFHQIRIKTSQTNFEPPIVSNSIISNAMNTIENPNWDVLREQINSCDKCNLCVNRNKAVFGDGVTNASVMIVGEAPGKDEDESGLPFVGRSGKLLDLVLQSVKLSRQDNVFITNVVKCRPEKNRDPIVSEIQTCRAYLDAQIALVKPKLIIAVGRISAQTLLNTKAKIGDLRDQVFYLENNTPVVVIYHPAYLLRMPTQKAVVWQDLKKYKKLFADT